MLSPALPRWSLTGVHGGVAVALLLGAEQALAGDVRVTQARCVSDIHVVAHEAPLSAVLKKLSTVLDFQLRFDSDSDPLVTLDATQRAEELPARLAPSGNVTMMLERDPRCSDRQRIVKVWVLPGASTGAPRTSVASVQSDEQARQAKDGAEMILRAHGMDASGQPLPQ